MGTDLSDFFKEKFQELVGNSIPMPQEVEVVMGRTLKVVKNL